MSAQILDGKLLAGRLREELRQEVLTLKESTGAVPRLINVMIGRDPGSCAYANSQKRVAEAVGIQYELSSLPEDVDQRDLLEHVRQLNRDASVHGIMIHKPVPQQIDYRAVANGIETAKDLEGINVTNVGKMLLGSTKMIPCTPAAVMEHIRSTGVPLRGKDAVVVGASEIVGKPLSLLLLREYVTTTVCHVATAEAGRLPHHVGQADILVVAVGKPGVVKGDWIKPGAIVIDVGINQVGNRIVGDVEFEAAKQKASFITPVPGGVGPVTVVMLMRNGIEAYKLQLWEKSLF
ncbi:MAG: bifunctional 5,10-methylenetetrahydrofolate dehydrogenase/5,10-methenyltetrahydrofolate cyclohydrolase [Candidatus Omnitrophota bacterium]|nr:bifunctional 5,10-methylenetetrahydrofolate dehydrogenase/5,10-methenyltetrahydrofolate cyclohydrolase [Candidatus Omnitrophota bacterium]MDZ4242959.1 bifunctional 5,10-methylenetetrahydrofolate dehydrogenase/5,10-methenyltetrahydrofolate cyclohydrolase [Candidatus Omnitrophota bacterium]